MLSGGLARGRGGVQSQSLDRTKGCVVEVSSVVVTLVNIISPAEASRIHELLLQV